MAIETPWHNPSDLVYHYTSIDALISMIENKCFWASDLAALNDPAELIYIHDVFRDAVQKWPFENISSVPDEEQRHVYSFLSNVWEQYRRSSLFGEYPDRIMFETGHIFGVSFCGAPDLLSQWRAYGLDGNGVCLGFETKRLERGFGTGSVLATVEYSPENHTEHSNKLIANLVDRYRALRNKSKEEQELEAMKAADEAMSVLAIDSHRFKLAAFSEEREQRLIRRLEYASDDCEVKIRMRRGHVIPYIELRPTDGLLPLRSILTGPSYRSHHSNYAIQRLLKKRGFEDMKLESCKFTLR